ncbi:glycosyltransferase [Kiritimatiellaeota bacterium B1221]|nr:glycosyltransferase [Kiritimatiellaeota bacterium B1221]
MYIFQQPDVTYIDPWELTFDQRYQMLLKRDQRIAYYYTCPDNSTFRYRVFNMVEVLNNKSSQFSASWFAQNDFHRIEEVLQKIQTLVICRVQFSFYTETLLVLAKKYGVNVVYDIDDYVFDPSIATTLMQTLNQPFEEAEEADWNFWFSYTSRHGELLKRCDSLVCTNTFLAEKLSAYAGKSTEIIPNFINSFQSEISHEILMQKIQAGFKRDAQIHIGYFSGTPTHNRDFAIVSHALANILDKNPEAILRIAGYLEFPAHLKPHLDRIEFIPFQNFIALQNSIAQVEINIAPLQINDFTNCKSELKLFESSIVGTQTLASPSYTYAKAISHGQNGYLAREGEWEDTLQHIIDTIDFWPQQAERVRDENYITYHWSQQLDTITSALKLTACP